MTRRYCWRIGGSVEFDDPERCPECGYYMHPAYPDQDMCGKFVPIKNTSKGEWCTLHMLHDGDCMNEPREMLRKMGSAP